MAALGGNAVVSYIMKQCVFMENPSKNQVRPSTAAARKSEKAPLASSSSVLPQKRLHHASLDFITYTPHRT